MIIHGFWAGQPPSTECRPLQKPLADCRIWFIFRISSFDVCLFGSRVEQKKQEVFFSHMIIHGYWAGQPPLSVDRCKTLWLIAELDFLANLTDYRPPQNPLADCRIWFVFWIYSFDVLLFGLRVGQKNKKFVFHIWSFMVTKRANFHWISTEAKYVGWLPNFILFSESLLLTFVCLAHE